MARTKVKGAGTRVPTAEPAKGAPPKRDVLQTEVVGIGLLTPHPRNYQGHPDDQLLHLGASLKQHGFYRNVVCARDLTILAGHGIVEAAKRVGLTEVPIFRLDLDPASPRALKILAADNELGRFADRDDRALTEILKQIRDQDESALLGTGYDDRTLAALLMVTRPASEIKSINEAAEWVGMPEYDEGGTPIRVIITFATKEDREKFVKDTELRIVKVLAAGGDSWSARWPTVVNEDAFSLRFEEQRT